MSPECRGAWHAPLPLRPGDTRGLKIDFTQGFLIEAVYLLGSAEGDSLLCLGLGVSPNLLDFPKIGGYKGVERSSRRLASIIHCEAGS